ncbi:hypothetical protein GHK92_08955 [Nocardioides sp. dk4132]|uniref:hypothetical protein n=1 Tax=unclassified Nocardioides TaxID=2615069 RepID=UPI00129737E6|nr:MULTISPECIES: hypothetical protein [unclassified Nocardioides]MQW76002.1 hypothetical protein [Nocardioides sp. dk4132]QGA08855.1 hypothetical protein GFH29_16715 [Nocardioides sp. dk884]
MIGPLDEYPLHQAPLPIGWPASSDRNFYDRSYFNAHDRSGEIFVITGLGYYPNLGTKDAFLLVAREGRQTAVHLSDLCDGDRLHQRVGGYRLDVVEPLQRLHLELEETDGIAADLTWTGSFPVLQELPHVLRSGARVTLDAQRFAQVGTWEGHLSVDGERIEVTPDRWVGTRDRSWGVRPVGEAEPAGAPSDPPFEGMWWLYVPMRFEDFAVVVILQEDPDGYRTLNDCHRIHPDGRVEQLGWPQVRIHYAPGGRTPTGATIRCTTPAGEALELEVTSLLAAPLHVGGGYGGDPDWLHGTWKGEKFTERVTYDLTDPAVQGRVMFGCTDHVGRAVLTEGGRTHEGWGLFEHFCIGRHDPSGFTDFLQVAPTGA